MFGSSDEDEIKSAVVLNTLLNRQVDGFIMVPYGRHVKTNYHVVKKKKPYVSF